MLSRISFFEHSPKFRSLSLKTFLSAPARRQAAGSRQQAAGSRQQAGRDELRIFGVQ